MTFVANIKSNGLVIFMSMSTYIQLYCAIICITNVIPLTFGFFI